MLNARYVFSEAGEIYSIFVRTTLINIDSITKRLNEIEEPTIHSNNSLDTPDPTAQLLQLIST